MTVQVQFVAMLSMCLSGFYLGAALDTFRRLSFYWNHKQLLTYFFEISFWMTQTTLLFYVLYQVNAGELRIYIFAACLLGFSIYQVIAATAYQVLLEKIIYLITDIYRFCKTTFYLLVVAPIKWLLYIVLQTIRLMVGLVLSIVSVILMPVKWIIQFGYYLLPQRIKKKIRKLPDVYSIIKSRSIKWIRNILFKER